MKTTHLIDFLAEHAEVHFPRFADFNDHGFNVADITGVAPGWEMHPDTDEFFYVIDGEFEVTLMMPEGPEHHVAGAGTAFVVPKGIWHKPAAPGGAKFIFHTPGESLTSDAEDPR
ncbi:MAG: cupin domain-containing protein [Pseudomonadota bacterium]